MNRTWSDPDGPQSRVPRACGDEPHVITGTADYSAVFPAPAGMNRGHGPVDGQIGGVPRACGDEPIGAAEVGTVQVCSPRLRG